jgi:hypothetical protein
MFSLAISQYGMESKDAAKVVIQLRSILWLVRVIVDYLFLSRSKLLIALES